MSRAFFFGFEGQWMSILGRLLAGSKGEAADARERADALITRGQGQEDAGDYSAAEASFREALALTPSYPRAHLNLGNSLHKQKRFAEAVTAHAAAIALDPAYVPGHFNAGAVLVEHGRWPEAKPHLERALALQPDLADAAVLLAMAYEGEGDLPGACRELERAIAIQPRLAGAWANLGTLLVQRNRMAEGERAFSEALRIDPDNAPALAGLAQLDVNRGRSRQAAALFERALEIVPDDPLLWGTYLFSLNLRDDVDGASVAREHFKFGELLERKAPATPLPARPRNARIRVGYVSGDLLAHPVAWFLLPVLAHHDRNAFETFCYSSGHVDDMTPRVRGAADHWRPIARREDSQVVDLIRQDGIDVLVDLSGHTPRNRLGVFCRRAAPVQATWLGYLNTTGLRSMDFRITDRHADPEGASEALHTEKLARLPDSQWAYVPHNVVALKAMPRPPGAPVVFGSFNQMAKVSDGCLDLWSEVLRRVPGSILRVHAVPDDVAKDDLLARLARRGVDASRVEVRGRVATVEYLAAIADVDIALDSMPYNGGTTTLDTFYMGVPLVALAGIRGISRGSYSIAKSAGLEELVAHSPAEYVERKVALANDPGARLALRQSIRPRLEASPLMDPVRFTRDLEALYRGMLNRAPSRSR
jgi:predicted O-linked N-acetylglucosamine transferase (SPINDLY family)